MCWYEQLCFMHWCEAALWRRRASFLGYGGVHSLPCITFGDSLFITVGRATRFTAPVYCVTTNRSFCFICPCGRLQSTVDKLIKKTNLALVVGSSSWREQFVSAVTVSAGESQICEMSHLFIPLTPDMWKIECEGWIWPPTSFPPVSLLCCFSCYFRYLFNSIPKAPVWLNNENNIKKAWFNRYWMKEYKNIACFLYTVAMLYLFTASFYPRRFIKNAWCGEFLMWLNIKTKLASCAWTINGLHIDKCVMVNPFYFALSKAVHLAFWTF